MNINDKLAGCVTKVCVSAKRTMRECKRMVAFLLAFVMFLGSFNGYLADLTGLLPDFSNVKTAAAAEEEDLQDESPPEDSSYTRLVLMTDDPDMVNEDDVILGQYGNLYLLSYETTEEAQAAYEAYLTLDAVVEPDVAVDTAGEGESNELTEDVFVAETGEDIISEEGNPFDILNEIAPMAATDTDAMESEDEIGTEDEELEDLEPLEETVLDRKIADGETIVIALIDTGTSEWDGVIDRVSVIDEALVGNNTHGDQMAAAIFSTNPNASILSIRALSDNGTGTTSSMIAAIEYAIYAGVDIINLSVYAKNTLTTSVLAAEIEKAVEAGIVVVGAAGNDGADAAGYMPGAVESAYIIGACDEDGNRKDFSNYGATVDYNVVADSTSEATALFTGFLSANGIAKIADALSDGLIFETGWVIATDTNAEPATETDAETATDPDEPGDAQTGDDVATGTDAEEGNDTEAPDHTATGTDAEEDFKIALSASLVTVPGGSVPTDNVAMGDTRKTYLTDIYKSTTSFDPSCLGGSDSTCAIYLQHLDDYDTKFNVFCGNHKLHMYSGDTLKAVDSGDNLFDDIRLTRLVKAAIILSYIDPFGGSYYVNTDTGEVVDGMDVSFMQTQEVTRHVLGQFMIWRVTYFVNNNADTSSWTDQKLIENLFADDAVQELYTAYMQALRDQDALTGHGEDYLWDAIFPSYNAYGSAFLRNAIAGYFGCATTSEGRFSMSSYTLIRWSCSHCTKGIALSEHQPMYSLGTVYTRKESSVTVKITKNTTNGGVVANAKYTVYDDDGTTVLGVMTTDSNGQASLKVTWTGSETTHNIYIKETSAAPGTIIKDSSKEKFTLTAGETLDLDKSDSGIFENTPIFGEVAVTKTDYANGSTKLNLMGATFKLYQYVSSSDSYTYLETLTDNKDGTYSSSIFYYTKTNLGKFRIIETSAPSYYDIPTATRGDFSYDAENKYYYKDFALTTGKSSKQTFSFTARDDAPGLNLRVKKTSSDTSISGSLGDAQIQDLYGHTSVTSVYLNGTSYSTVGNYSSLQNTIIYYDGYQTYGTNAGTKSSYLTTVGYYKFVATSNSGNNWYLDNTDAWTYLGTDAPDGEEASLNYSLEGAEYTVYLAAITDPEDQIDSTTLQSIGWYYIENGLTKYYKKVGTLTTTETGYSNTLTDLDLNFGSNTAFGNSSTGVVNYSNTRYFIKETKSSKGYDLDTTIYCVTITLGDTQGQFKYNTYASTDDGKTWTKTNTPNSTDGTTTTMYMSSTLTVSSTEKPKSFDVDLKKMSGDTTISGNLPSYTVGTVSGFQGGSSYVMFTSTVTVNGTSYSVASTSDCQTLVSKHVVIYYDGSVTASSAKAGYYQFIATTGSSGNLAITATSAWMYVGTTLTDANDGYSLSGAQYSLYYAPLSDNYPNAWQNKGDAIATYTTDANGNLSITDLPINNGSSTYFLVETKSSLGFTLDNTVWSIHVWEYSANSDKGTDYVTYTVGKWTLNEDGTIGDATYPYNRVRKSLASSDLVINLTTATTGSIEQPKYFNLNLSKFSEDTTISGAMLDDYVIGTVSGFSAYAYPYYVYIGNTVSVNGITMSLTGQFATLTAYHLVVYYDGSVTSVPLKAGYYQFIATSGSSWNRYLGYPSAWKYLGTTLGSTNDAYSLAGAEYSLYLATIGDTTIATWKDLFATSVPTPVATATTDANGNLTFTNLPLNTGSTTYFLVETKSSKGFELDNVAWYVHVWDSSSSKGTDYLTASISRHTLNRTANGLVGSTLVSPAEAIQYSKTLLASPATIDLTVDDDDAVFRGSIETPKTFDIDFLKESGDTEISEGTKSTPDGTSVGSENYSLAGAEYTLYQGDISSSIKAGWESREVVGVYTTDEDGHIVITDLPIHTSKAAYFFTETKSSEGYQLDPTIWYIHVWEYAANGDQGTDYVTYTVNKYMEIDGTWTMVEELYYRLRSDDLVVSLNTEDTDSIEAPKYLALHMTKVSGDPVMTEDNDNYTLEGAQYTLYRVSTGTTLALQEVPPSPSDNTMIISDAWNLLVSDGFSDSAKVGTYTTDEYGRLGYVKDGEFHPIIELTLNDPTSCYFLVETLPSEGFLYDTVIRFFYAVDVTGGNEMMVSAYAAQFTKDDVDQTDGDWYRMTTTADNWIADQTHPESGSIINEMDEQTLTLNTVSGGYSISFTSTEPVSADPVGIEIEKIESEGVENPASLAGAQFTVKFYAVDIDQYTSLDSLSGLTPTRVWVLETKYCDLDGTGVYGYYTSLAEEFLVSGSDALYYDETGNPVIPLGVLTIEETKAADGYTTEGGYINDATGEYVSDSDGVIFITSGQDGLGTLGKLNTGNYYTKVEVRKTTELLIHKVNRQGEPLAGAVFLLEYLDEESETYVPVFYSESVPVIGGCTNPDLTGYGEYETGCLITDETGDIVFTGLHPDVQYRLTELAAPAGYVKLSDFAYVGYLQMNAGYILTEDGLVELAGKRSEDEIYADSEEPVTLELSVINSTGYALPMTGATTGFSGFLPLIVLMLLLAVAMYLAKDPNVAVLEAGAFPIASTAVTKRRWKDNHLRTVLPGQPPRNSRSGVTGTIAPEQLFRDNRPGAGGTTDVLS